MSTKFYSRVAPRVQPRRSALRRNAVRPMFSMLNAIGEEEQGAFSSYVMGPAFPPEVAKLSTR